MFVVLRIVMNSQKMFNAKVNEAKMKKPTSTEKKELLERGVNLKDKDLLEVELKKLREEKKKQAEEDAKAKYKPTELDILTEIRELLKQNINHDKE